MEVEKFTEFFREICSDSKSYMNYEKLSKEGYECVLGFFLRRNKDSKRLIQLGQETRETVFAAKKIQAWE
jgi:hypothetical protein